MSEPGQDTDEYRQQRERELEELRNGGPTRTPGIMTTTGGTAGPASVAEALRRHQAPGGEDADVAPTTTGDTTSGGMDTPAAGATSDDTTAAARIGNVTDR